MGYPVRLAVEIERLKQLLQVTAQEHKYNFGHPQVLEISQKLDQLIVKLMRHKKPPSS